MGSPKKSYDAYYFRLVESNVNHINEHLEAMQRDAHGLEFVPWKLEVDDIWKRTFEIINSMNEDVQKRALELIKETWTTYITHYNVISVVED